MTELAARSIKETGMVPYCSWQTFSLHLTLYTESAVVYSFCSTFRLASLKALLKTGTGRYTKNRDSHGKEVQPMNKKGQKGTKQGQPGLKQGQPGLKHRQQGTKRGKPWTKHGQQGTKQGQSGIKQGQQGTKQG